MGQCFIFGVLIGIILIAYLLIDVHYFVRMIINWLVARYIKKRCHVLDTTEITGICLSNDIDTLLFHMNNARYLREGDFARVDFYERTQLYRKIKEKGGTFVQGGTTIRYRRFIKPYSIYKLTSKIIYWDDQSIYMEHRFISKRDGFINSLMWCKQRVINCSVEEIMNSLLTDIENKPADGVKNIDCENIKAKPELPLEVAKWIEANELSSATLRHD